MQSRRSSMRLSSRVVVFRSCGLGADREALGGPSCKMILSVHTGKISSAMLLRRLGCSSERKKLFLVASTVIPQRCRHELNTGPAKSRGIQRAGQRSELPESESDRLPQELWSHDWTIKFRPEKGLLGRPAKQLCPLSGKRKPPGNWDIGRCSGPAKKTLWWIFTLISARGPPETRIPQDLNIY